MTYTTPSISKHVGGAVVVGPGRITAEERVVPAPAAGRFPLERVEEVLDYDIAPGTLKSVVNVS